MTKCMTMPTAKKQVGNCDSGLHETSFYDLANDCRDSSVADADMRPKSNVALAEHIAQILVDLSEKLVEYARDKSEHRLQHGNLLDAFLEWVSQLGQRSNEASQL